MAKKKMFNQEAGSIAETLQWMPKEVRERYRRNRAKFEADQASLRTWAQHGFVGGGSSLSDSDVLRWESDEETDEA